MLRVGVIGTSWGRMHVGAFRAVGAQIVGLCGLDLERTRRIAAEEGIPWATTEVQALCSRVDAVVVASPPSVHAEHVRCALSLRRPVLCEKPLTPKAHIADALVKESQQHGVFCAVNFPYRMLPTFERVRRWISTHSPRQSVVTVRNGFAPTGPDGSGDAGGASHVVDACLWLFGEPAQAIQSSYHQGSLAMTFRTGGDAEVHLHHLAGVEPGIFGQWSILGEGWEVGFSASYVPARNGWCLSPVRLLTEGRWTDLAPGDEPAEGRREPWAQAHVETARAFVQTLNGTPDERLASFSDAARVQRLLHAATNHDV